MVDFDAFGACLGLWSRRCTFEGSAGGALPGPLVSILPMISLENRLSAVECLLFPCKGISPACRLCIFLVVGGPETHEAMKIMAVWVAECVYFSYLEALLHTKSL